MNDRVVDLEQTARLLARDAVVIEIEVRVDGGAIDLVLQIDEEVLLANWRDRAWSEIGRSTTPLHVRAISR